MSLQNYTPFFSLLIIVVTVSGFIPSHGSDEIIPRAASTSMGDVGALPGISSDIIDNLPDDVTVDLISGIITWTSPHADELRLVVVPANDVVGGLDFQFADISMFDVSTNALPVLFPISDKTADELVQVAFTVFAIDPDGPDGALRYALVGGGPNNDRIDSITGKYEWVPTETQGGAHHNVTVAVTDNSGASDYETFSIEVNEINEPPYLDRMPRLVTDEHSLLTFPVVAFDPDLPANILTYSLSGEPFGAVISQSDTGWDFTWTPNENQDGLETFAIIVSDGAGGSFGQLVIVDVREINEPPVLDKISAHSVCAGSILAFSAIATDPDLPANALTYSLVGEPFGAAIATADGTGSFLWIPHESQIGTHLFEVVVSDGVVFGNPQTIAVHVCPPTRQSSVPDKVLHPAVHEFFLPDLTDRTSDPDGVLVYILTIARHGSDAIDPVTWRDERPDEKHVGPPWFLK